MIMICFLFLLGLILICVGGDRFVDASVTISSKLGIPKLVIGATIVSIGTTLPEVLVSTTAAFQGSGDIAAGNAIGSIICNTALIAGFSQLVKPAKDVEGRSFNWRTIYFLVAAVFVTIIAYFKSELVRPVGIILLIAFAVYAYINIKSAGSDMGETTQESDGLVKSIIVLVVCAIALFAGARLLVDNGILIAKALHVPERVIAVTFIALGTSLPELVTAVTSLIKGHSDMSLGNIIGANIMNLLVVLGIPAAITGIQLDNQVARLDTPVAAGVMLLLVLPFIIKKRGYRWQGALLLLIYGAYCVLQF